MKTNLYKAGTIENAVQPVILIGQFFGLCSINTTKRNEKMSFEPSTAKSFYTFGFALAYIVISVFCFLSQDEDDDTETKGTNVSIFKEFVMKYLPFTLVLTVLVSSHFQKQHFVRFLQILHAVDNDLEQAGLQMNYQAIRKQFLVELSVVIVFSLSLVACYFYFYSLLSSITYTMTVIIIVATFSQFIGCLKIIKQIFAMINKQVNLWQSHGNLTFVQSTGSTLLLPMNKIRILSMSHDGICEAAQFLNSVYTVQMLLYTGLVFLGALFAIFSDFRALFGFDVSLENSIGKQIIKNSAMSIFTFGLMVKILYECSATSDEVSILLFYLLIRYYLQ